MLTMREAEEVIDGRSYLRPGVQAGDVVKLKIPGTGIVMHITIAPESLDCDCGKGVLCPWNKQSSRVAKVY